MVVVTGGGAVQQVHVVGIPDTDDKDDDDDKDDNGNSRCR